jgi:hypothetical protein
MDSFPERPHDDPSDEELILYHYGEAADAAAIAARLASSPAANRRYQELRRVLAAADEWSVPEPGPSYEADLWTRLQPRLQQSTPRSRLLAAADRFGSRGRRWLPAAAAAALLLAVGYLAGRLAPRPEADPVRALSAEARQRILVETLAGHLERSQRLFTELANLTPGDDGGLQAEQAAARQLLADNRLYRTAAAQGGREGVAALLTDIEPVLLELAHLPAEPEAGEVDFLRQRIESRGLLFKTRVASELLSRSLRPATAPPSRSTV